MNTFFMKKEKHKWTWRGPNGTTKNEIDYILTNKKHIVHDVSVINNFKFYSDHRLVCFTISINTKWERTKLCKKNRKNINTKILASKSKEFEIELKNRFDLLDNNHDDLDQHNTEITDTLLSAVKSIAIDNSVKKCERISEETKTLIKKRKTLNQDKNNISKIEYSELCKTIRKNIRQDIRKYNTNQIENTIKTNKNMKIMRRNLNTGRDQILNIREKDGNITSDPNKITKCFHELFTEIFKETIKSTPNHYNKDQQNVNNPIPDITPSEIQEAMEKMKNGKASGEDEIIIEYIKSGGKILIDKLTILYTLCLKRKMIPKAWNNATIIMIFKKGDKLDPKNYRPISLLSVLYKLFTKIITNRLTRQLDDQQPKEQAGFRSGYGTIDHIHTVNQLIEKSEEFQKPLCMAFIDYKKAFDSLKTNMMIKALKKQEINDIYLELIENIYDKATATIKLRTISESIKMERGIRQGDSISPKLFTATLQEIFKSFKWQTKGILISGERLTNLRFADDVILFSESAEELDEMINNLNIESKIAGLEINKDKTKIMYNKFATPKQIIIDKSNIEIVTSYTYLGQQININDSNEKEIKRRIQLAWYAFGKLKEVFRGEIPVCLKRKVFDQCILPVLTYAGETWRTTEKLLEKIRVTQRKMERIMLGVTLKDRKTNDWIRKQTQITDAVTKIKSLKWQWAGHIARMDKRWTKILTKWEPQNSKRRRGRPKRRWIDDIKAMTEEDWSEKAKDRERWKILGETYIQQWIDNG